MPAALTPSIRSEPLIRLATPSDAPALAGLVAAHPSFSGRSRAAPAPPRPPASDRSSPEAGPIPWASAHWSLFWVGERRGTILAAVACYDADLMEQELARTRRRSAILHAASPHRQRRWRLDHLVAADGQRDGTLMRLLIEHAVGEGAERGFSQAFADLSATCAVARRALVAAGFVPIDDAVERASRESWGGAVVRFALVIR